MGSAVIDANVSDSATQSKIRVKKLASPAVAGSEIRPYQMLQNAGRIRQGWFSGPPANYAAALNSARRKMTIISHFESSWPIDQGIALYPFSAIRLVSRDYPEIRRRRKSSEAQGGAKRNPGYQIPVPSAPKERQMLAALCKSAWPEAQRGSEHFIHEAQIV